MGLPPLAGAVQVTVAELLPAVADTPVGAPGAVGAPVVVTDTSSRYIQESSGGLAPSSWSLNHSTTVWPAYGVVSKVTLVQVWALVFDLKTWASVCPEVSRIWASCQS